MATKTTKPRARKQLPYVERIADTSVCVTVETGDLNEPRCKRGHPRTPANTITRKNGWKVCKVCNRNSYNKYRQNNGLYKMTMVEPESEYVAAADVPVALLNNRLRPRYWEIQVERAMLLEFGEAIRVPLDELFLTGAGTICAERAARKLKARVEVRVTAGGIYIIQRGQARERGRS